jgi:hypothetical protein
MHAAGKRRKPHQRNEEDSMSQRRTLTAGLKTPVPPVDPDKEKEFVYGPASEAKAETPASPAANDKPPVVIAPARVPLSTRMRGDFADALKTASLQRQLQKIQPNTLTDILEEAIEPWLRKNGYLT